MLKIFKIDKFILTIKSLSIKVLFRIRCLNNLLHKRIEDPTENASSWDRKLQLLYNSERNVVLRMTIIKIIILMLDKVLRDINEGEVFVIVFNLEYKTG